MMRIILFLATNLAITIVISLVFNLFGLSGVLNAQGTNLDLGSLWVMSLVVGMTGSFISLMLSKTMAKSSMGVQVISSPQDSNERWLVETVARLAAAAGIGMPEVGVFQSPDANAFATGMNRNNALVAVSTGLLNSMDPSEVEAVIGHEITHVANGDMITMGLMQGVLNTFVYFFASLVGYFVDRVVFRNEEGQGAGYYITQMIAQMLFGFLASLLLMWFSRYREFKADAGGAKLAGRDGMINALKALQRIHEPATLPGQLAAFGITGGGISKLLMSHPPLSERIAALQNNR